MNLWGFHAKAMQIFENILAGDCPQFSWAGKVYTIVPNSVMSRRPLQYGGFTQDADLRFSCLIAQFGLSGIVLKNTMLQTQMGYLGELYKVTSVDILPGGLTAVINCDSLYQNA